MKAGTTRRGSDLRPANPAEILRARQRDDDFVGQLREGFSDLLHKFGRRKALLHLAQSELPARLLYFAATSGSGNQTLGEEYTGIVQANLKARRVPSLIARVLAAVLECFGERMLLRLLDRLRASVNRADSELTPAAVSFLNAFLVKLRAAIPVFILVHRGLFYVLGRYYSLGRRFAGVGYVKVYGRRPGDDVSWGLRLLGVATLAQCALRLWRDRMSSAALESDRRSTELEEGAGGKCHLCLEASPTTATPCGHLFCWSCLADWLRGRPRCPLCRERVPPSRIVHLLNL